MINKIDLNLSKKLFVPKFFPYLLDYSHRWEFYMGSAGSAKSYFITQKMILRAVREPIRILVCRRYASTIRQTCFNLFKEILKKWKLMEYVKINETDFRITFTHNNSEIIFCGLDDETKLLSLNNIGSIFIEEVYEVPQEIVEQLNLRMRGNVAGQQILMAWNPISKNHWLYDFSVVNPPENSLFIHSTYKDNPFLNKEYVDALEELRVRNPAKAKIYCDGEWGSLDRLIYENWKVEDFDYLEYGNLPLLCGLDFGFVNDPTAFIASLLDEENKRIYIFKEWGATGKTNPEIARVITSLGFAKSLIICDSAEQKSIEELRRNGIMRPRASVKGPDSIIFGIDRLQEYQLIVHPSCQETITELENYSWQKDKEGNYINKPVDAFNHFLDALRYSLQCVASPKMKTFSKGMLGL